MYGLHAGNRHELMYLMFTFDTPTATSEANRIRLMVIHDWSGLLITDHLSG